MEAVRKRIPDWALVVACVLPFLGFWTYGLFDLDEGFYGAVVADMIRRHDWITPTYHGVPWFEKPVLAYWLAIPSVQVFGDLVGPRLPSVLCTLATGWVLFRFAKRHFDGTTARLGVVVFSTNLLVVGIGRMMMTDAPLVLCLTLAVTTLFDSLCGKPKLRLWSAFFVGLGVLAKGPVAAVLFLVVAGVALWRMPDKRSSFRGYWLLGTLVCFMTLAVWYLPCYLANGRLFVQDFLIEQNLGRFTGGDKAHAVPWWAHLVYYPLILLVSFLPWTCLPGWTALKSVWPLRRPVSQAAPDEGVEVAVQTYLWAWALVPLAFFTISGTKLPHYILPSVPPLALLLARALSRSGRKFSWEQIGLAWAAFLLVVVQFGSHVYWERTMREVQSLARSVPTPRAPLAVYKVGGSGDTSISMTLRPTSHPSVFFYRDQNTYMTDDFRALLPGFVLTTRDVYLSDLDLRQLHPRLVPVPGVEQRDYVLLQVGESTAE